jgi:hypothetical protein
MAETSADELRRVYAQLTGIRRNLLPQSSERDAERFHEQLDRLDRAGYNVAEFRLDPDRDLYRHVRSISGHGEQTYADTKTIHSGVLESKLDAILHYFQGTDGQEPMSFSTPRKY